MEIINLSVILITVLLTLLYWYIKKCQSYWKDNNVVHLEPEFLFGNFKRVLKKEILLIDVNQEIYNKVKEQGKTFGGIYSFLSPICIPVDLDLIKNILQTDFSHFVNHGAYINEKKEPLTVNIFNLEDIKWKNLRAKLSPSFTTGKMKMMFPTLQACSKELEVTLKEAAENVKNGIDIKDIIGRYTTDTISSIGFGLDSNSMKDPESDFRKYGKMFFDPTVFENRVWFAFTFLPRWFTTRLNLRTMSKKMETFYMNLVRDTVAYREKHNIYRKDMLHLLIQLKNLGEIGEDDDKRLLGENMNNAPGLTMNELAAQAFIFMVAGFETASSTSTYALLELAQRQDIQDKLREEIIEVLKKHDNKLTYEAISEMEYLEKTVLETGRKHPPVPFLIRICGKDYQVPNTNFVLKAGTRVNIPTLQIQRDPKYYPDPDNFDPERFSAENKAKRHPMTYLPFGEGPRNCIGLRFGKLQAKLALCTILRNYKVTLNEKTQMPIKYEMIFVTAVKGGVWINLEPLS